MSRINNNALLQELEGKMGKTHAYRKVRGKMYMVNLPKTGRPLSEDRKAFTERFSRAVKYALDQVNDPNTKELYQGGITPKKHNAYLVAISDYLNAPKIGVIKTRDYKGSAGDIIKIEAEDDFRVVRVLVSIYGSDGELLEEGDALHSGKQSDPWIYTATEENPSVAGTRISVTAFDKPDNETTREVTL